MNSIASAAIRSSATGVLAPPPRDVRIIGTGLRGNKVLCPRTHPHVRPHPDTLVVHSPSTDFSEDGGRKGAGASRTHARSRVRARCLLTPTAPRRARPLADRPARG